MTGPTVEGSIVANVKADISNLEENVTRAQAKLEALTGKKTEVTVGANTASAEAQMRALQDAVDKVATAETRLAAAERLSQNAASQSRVANLRLEHEMSKRGRTELSVAVATEASARADRNAEAAELRRAAATEVLAAAQKRLKTISDAVLSEGGGPSTPASGGGAAPAATPAVASMAAVVGVVVAAVVGGMSVIAAIANAAVAGLLILANAFGAVMAAGGLLVVAFSGLSAQLAVVAQQQTLAAIPTNQLTKAQKDQLEQLNKTIAGYGAYVGTISTLKTALLGLRGDITSALFTAATPGIAAITDKLLPQVKGALLGYATVVGSSLSSVLSSLSSAGGVDALNKLLKGAQTLLPPLTSAALSLGSALGHIFLDALPATQGFVDALAKVTDRFNTFIASNPDKVKQFFTDGVTILGAFGGMLSGIGKTMSSLVTPDVVKQTVDFLNNLRDSAPFFQTLLQVAGKLQIFNLIGQLFDKVGNALRPLLNILAPLMSIAYDLVSTTLSSLGIALQTIALILTPVGWGFQLLADAFAKMQPYIDMITSNAAAMFDVLQKGADAIWKGIKPALDDLFKSIFGGLPTPARLAEVFQTKVLPALQSFTDAMVKDIVPTVSIAIDMMTGFVKSLGGFDGIKAKLEAAAGFFKTFGLAVSLVLTPIEITLQGISRLIDLIAGRHSSISSITQGSVGAAVAKPHTAMATGGSVWGAGSGLSDSIPALLSSGEFVVTAAAASAPGVRPALNRLNANPSNGLASARQSHAVINITGYTDPGPAVKDGFRQLNLRAA